MGKQLDKALALHRSGDLAAAERLYEGLYRRDSGDREAAFLLGVLRLTQQRDAEALQPLQRAVRLAPSEFEAIRATAEVLDRLGEHAEAIAMHRRAAALRPQDGLVHLGLGGALIAAGEIEAARASFETAVRLRPDRPEAKNNLALALKMIGRIDDAAATFEATARTHPTYEPAPFNLGKMLSEQGDMAGAEPWLERALAIAPGFVEAKLALAGVLRETGRTDAAVTTVEAILAVAPDHAVAAVWRCTMALAVVYADDAEVARRRADYTAALKRLAAQMATDPRRYLAGLATTRPFLLAYQGEDDRVLQERYGRLLHAAAAAAVEVPTQLQPKPRRRVGGRLRVGIVSGYFRDHSVWKIPTRGWLVGLDRTRIEIVCFHTGLICDAQTEAARRLADTFVDGPADLATWATRITESACDVLLYPEIGMDAMASLLAALRLAPIQANGLGHPVTSGLPTMDYALSSALMEPDGAQSHYSETLVRLPNLGVHYDYIEAATGATMPAVARRAALGVADEDFVFWCGQSLFKYQPRFDDTFAQIALAAPRARFVFIGYQASEAVTAIFADRLRRFFDRHGLRSADHCRFLPRLSTAQFSASAGQCDAILDSIGWAGFNSTMESLVHDLPLVTMAGPFMRGRHGAAILRRMGLAESVASTAEAFIARAARLANDPGFAAASRSEVAARKSALFGDMVSMDHLSRWLLDVVTGTGLDAGDAEAL